MPAGSTGWVYSPIPVIVAPSTVSKCDDLVLDATLSSNSLGRDFQSVQWLLTALILTETGGEIEIDTLTLNENLIEAASNNRLVAEIPSIHMVPGITYKFTLVLTNFLEKSVSSTVRVSKLDSYAPHVVVQGTSSRTVLRPDRVNLQADVSFPQVCANEAGDEVLGEYSLGLSWNVTQIEGAER